MFDSDKGQWVEGEGDDVEAEGDDLGEGDQRMRGYRVDWQEEDDEQIITTGTLERAEVDKYDGAFQKTKEVSASAKKNKDTNDECVLQLRGGGCDNGIDEDQSSRFIWVLKNVRSIQCETRFETE